jgi:nucleoid-associated protein YgaU
MLVLATLLPASSVHAPMSPAPVAVVPLAPQLVEAPAALPPPAVPATSYRVRRGDALWTIAVRTLGDGYRWREIWRANAGRRMASGERFVDPDRIRPGWVLRLQRPAPTAGAG